MNTETIEFAISLTDAAHAHFKKLLSLEDASDTNLRIFAVNIGTPRAEVGITFCPAGDEKDSDHKIDYDGYSLFVDGASIKALQEAEIDYVDNEMEGQLSIKAPYIKGKTPSEDAPLYEKVDHIIQTEINPQLAGHGGVVSLVECDEKIGRVVLQFGGGCHGCGMADVTLKDGIEKTLKEKFSEIKEVVDATDHSTGTNPYY